MRDVRSFEYSEEEITIEGVTFTKLTLSMVVMTLDIPDRIQHRPAPKKRRAVVKPRFWMFFSSTIARFIVDARFADQTWLHVPSHIRRLARWSSLPVTRKPTELEQFLASSDYVEFASLSSPIEILQRGFSQ